MLDQIGIDSLLHTLLRHGGDIVASGAQDFLPALTEVLIELEFHATGSSGTVT